VTAAGIASFHSAADKTWPLRATEVSAWLGFWVMRDWYPGCFPINVSAANTNALLVVFGAVQGAVVGLVYDLLRRFLASRKKS
jgi:hypothetical protein